MVILGSGRGSNARALLTAWREGRLGRAEPVALISDRADAPILQFGPEFGLPAIYLPPGPFRTKLSPEAELVYTETIRALRADLIVLAGFMRVLKSGFLNAFPRQVINLHPSLLPAFKGLEAIRQAHEYGVKITGCTVHYVTADIDSGPILDQEPVRVFPGESLDQLSARVHAAEHQLLPRVVAALAGS